LRETLLQLIHGESALVIVPECLLYVREQPTAPHDWGRASAVSHRALTRSVWIDSLAEAEKIELSTAWIGVVERCRTLELQVWDLLCARRGTSAEIESQKVRVLDLEQRLLLREAELETQREQVQDLERNRRQLRFRLAERANILLKKVPVLHGLGKGFVLNSARAQRALRRLLSPSREK
ncbi:MAG TPA: hypothetical protein VGY58_00870, partial [Gemmataceae bacterium]|nr:hypothetical protein [Gemmataceae bacterium]